MEEMIASPPSPAPRTVEARRVRALVLGRLLGERPEPTQVGRFELRGRLGAGTCGVVYVAHDPSLSRKVALKLYQGELVGAQRTRMVREAQALAQVNHPNVVGVHEVGEHGHELYIAMEYVDGQTLGEWCEAAEPSWREIVETYVQAGRGLAAIHAAGLVHRDFKPQNAMRGSEGRVRVLDLGLVSAEISPTLEQPAAPDLDSPLTQTGALVGTPAYMAPEQLCGNMAGPASDQFALCVSLWEALFGARPFVGNSIPALLDAIEAGPPRVPRGRGRARVPARLGAVLRRGLSCNARERFADMSALVEALEALIRPRSGAVWTALGVAACALVGIAVLAIPERRASSSTERHEGLVVDAPLPALEPEGDEPPRPASPDPRHHPQSLAAGYVAGLRDGGPLHPIISGEGWQADLELIIAGNFGATGHDDLLYYNPRLRERQLWHTNGSGGWDLHTMVRDDQAWVQMLAGQFGSKLQGQDLLLEGAGGKVELWNYWPATSWQRLGELQLPAGTTTLAVGDFIESSCACDDLLVHAPGSGEAFVVELDGLRVVEVHAIESWDEAFSVAPVVLERGDEAVLARVVERGAQWGLDLVAFIDGRSVSLAEPLPLPGPALVRSGSFDSRGALEDLFVCGSGKAEERVSASVVTIEGRRAGAVELRPRWQGEVSRWTQVVPLDFSGDSRDELLFYGQGQPPLPPMIALEQRVEGALELQDLDNPTRKGRFADDYRVLPGVEQLRFELSSADFEPHLQIVDPGTGDVFLDGEEGEIHERNGSRILELRMSVDPGYNYTVRVTSKAKRALGGYALELVP